MSVWVCVWVFCAFAYLWEKGQHQFLLGLDTLNALSPAWRQTREGDLRGEARRDWRRICCSQTTGACYPLSSVEPGHQRQGHYNYPVSFIESAKLCYKLQSALYLWCGVKFIRGGMFYIKRHNLKKQNVTLSPLSFPKKEETINFIHFLLLQLISFSFFVRINIYKTYI